MKQAFSWWAFAKNEEPERLVREAARIGYAGVEMPPPDLWPVIRDAGLRIVSIGGHQSLSDGLNKRDNHARIENEIAAKLELAKEWDIPHLIVFSGNRNGQSDHAGAEATIAGLQRVAPLAEKAGVTLIMELLNSKVNHPDYQADRTEWGVRVCQAVASPRVKLLYDIYHMQIMEGDIIATLQKYGPEFFAHYHTAGVPGRHDLDDAQELNYPAIVRALAQTGYDGYLGHEFLPKGEPVTALQKAFEVCRDAPLPI